MGFIQCPICNQQYKLDKHLREKEGRYVRCKKCEKKFEIVIPDDERLIDDYQLKSDKGPTKPAQLAINKEASGNASEKTAQPITSSPFATTPILDDFIIDDLRRGFSSGYSWIMEKNKKTKGTLFITVGILVIFVFVIFSNHDHMNSQRGFLQNFENMELVLWDGGTEYYYEDFKLKPNDNGEWEWEGARKVGEGSTYNAYDALHMTGASFALGWRRQVVGKVEHMRIFIPATYGVFFGLVFVSIGFIARVSASQ